MSFSGIFVDSLVNIGKNMNLINGREKDFYEDQREMIECWLSKEIA